MSKMKIGVLASGRGSNLQAIMEQIAYCKLDAEIVVVLSDKENSFALKRAQDKGIVGITVLKNTFGSQIEFETALVENLKKHGAELVVLAGFMRVLSPFFIQQFPNRIINIHPSLLPSFPGLHAQKQALEYGVKFSGCTVHFVNEEVDGGPIISQALVLVNEGDTEESLGDRILVEEHRLLPEAIQNFILGKIEIQGRKTVIRKGGK
jgi:phosphoribosylglycinamide formyltransferase, formyltetrahydrofolate-dependent